MTDRTETVLDALTTFVTYVVNKKEMATPEELAALPQAAKIVLRHKSKSVKPKPYKTEICIVSAADYRRYISAKRKKAQANGCKYEYIAVRLESGNYKIISPLPTRSVRST
jgi:hypothetical protein